jgi:MFS family permease
MARAITKCPNCGSTVSQFAAGCAICGENLTAARQELERRRAARSIAAPGWFPEITAGDAILGVILTIAAFGSPLIGGTIAGLFAYFANERGDKVQRNLALIALAVAVIVIIVVSLLPDRGSLLLPWVDTSNPAPTNVPTPPVT